MRLKSLDVVGFKSFLEPTVISFSPGVTAVVGPNGCGKSNVVDAIRWVLGEQAPTRLRGKLAEDLIYAGNEANAPAGMAEVTLLLEADDNSSLPEPYAALSEIAVTRRVFRSGDADYLINRIPCRLKDITEFFMAAQVHSRGYAIVEQGRIEEIIQAKPLELRAMVEEAAGLALFKGRREMSERKLERVSENLARLDDVIGEIERQLGSARRQAKKAEVYRSIRAELDELEQLAMARRIFAERRALGIETGRENELRGQSESARAEAGALEEAAEQARAVLAELRDTIAQSERELANLRSAREERGRTRNLLERRLGRLDEDIPQIETRLRALEREATAARAARAGAGAQLARKRIDDDGEGEQRLAILRSDYETAERRLREQEQRLESLKDELTEVMREAAVARGRLADLAGERAANDERLEAIMREVPALEAALRSAESALATAEAASAGAQERVIELEQLQHSDAEREFELRSAVERSLRRLEAAVSARDRAELSARRIMPGTAGERLRAVLESLNGDRPATPPAMLLDVLKAPPALEPALRAVLGDQLDSVIVDSPFFALRAIEILKERASGRLSFIPEALPCGTPMHLAVDAPGIAGRLLEMVEVEPRFVPLAEALLGHVVIADDLRSAHAASNLNGHGTLFVTREGDVLLPDRMISGGSGISDDGAEVLGMRARVRALEAAAWVMQDAAEAHELLIRRCEWARLAAQDDVDELARARAQANSAEHQVGAARGAIAQVDQRIGLAEAGKAAARRRTDEIAALVLAGNQRLEALALAEQSARSRLSAAAEEVRNARLEGRRLGDELVELGARVESRNAALLALEQELRHQREKAAALETQLKRERDGIRKTTLERKEFADELDALIAQDEAAASRHAELEAALAELHCREQTCAESAENARISLGEARARLETIEAETADCRLRYERARTLSEELERGFAEKFQVEFAGSAGSLEERLTPRDGDRDAVLLGELRARAERIGEVNLAAAGEVSELEQREAGLSAERADLQAAANDLAHTIQKLNREARKRFGETFAAAAQNFAELFPKLLRGGKGRLELTEGDELDAGINILVQPAGKKVREIGLLSGGEKALSAMALIFSLFLLNPSPFCVLDEVDAPLDEFSLAAFTGLLGELKGRSQFLVVTHNQRTMQAADQIHGVTMERPGISRVISLKIPPAGSASGAA